MGSLLGVDNLKKIKELEKELEKKLEKKLTTSMEEGETKNRKIKKLEDQIDALKSFSAGYGKDLKQIESDIFEK